MKAFLIALLAVTLASCSSTPDTPDAAASHPGVVVMVRYTALPGQEQPALAAISGLVQEVIAREPQARGIEILRDASDQSRITLVERWPSRDLFLGPHMQQPHIQRFIAASRGFLAGPPEITFWDPIGSP